MNHPAEDGKPNPTSNPANSGGHELVADKSAFEAHDRRGATLEARFAKIRELMVQQGLSLDEALAKVAKRKIGAKKTKGKAKKDSPYLPQTDREVAVAKVRRLEHVRIAERAIKVGVAVLPIVSKVPQNISWTRLDVEITEEERVADVAHWRSKKENRDDKDPFGIGSTLDPKIVNALATKAGNGWMRGELAFGYCPGLAGVLVVDSDDKGGEAFIKFCADAGEPLDLDRIPVTISGSGGFHFPFANPDDLGNFDLKPYITADIKGRGGMIVLPGMVLPAKSDADHKQVGELRPYTRRPGSPDLFETIRKGGLLPIPNCLLKLIEEHGQEQRDRNDPAAEGAALAALSGDMTGRDVSVMIAECLEDKGFREVWENGILKPDHSEVDRSRTRFSIASRLSGKYGTKLDVCDLKLVYDECVILKGKDEGYDDRAVYRDYAGTADTRESAMAKEGPDGEAFGVADDAKPVQGEPVDPLSTADYVATGVLPPANKPADPPKLKRKVRCARYDEHIGLTPLDVVESLVEDLMTVGEVVVPAGAPGAGKSADLLHLSRCVAAGKPYHGRETTRGGVIFASSENVAEDERRIVAHRKHYGAAPRLPFLHIPQAMSLFNPSNDDPTQDETFIIVHAMQMEERTGIPCKLIVLDNLRRLISPGDTSKEPDIVRLMTVLERIRDKTGATVMLIAHTVRDGSRFAGSGAIESCADSVWHFEPEVLPGTKKNGKHVPVAPGFIRFEKLRLGDRKQKIELRMDVSTSVVKNNKGKPVYTVVSIDIPAVGAGIKADNDDTAPDLGPEPIVKPEAETKPVKPPEPTLVEKQKGALLEVLQDIAKGGKWVTRLAIEPDLKAKLDRRKLETVARTKLMDMLSGLREDGWIIREGDGKSTRYTLALRTAA